MLHNGYTRRGDDAPRAMVFGIPVDFLLHVHSGYVMDVHIEKRFRHLPDYAAVPLTVITAVIGFVTVQKENWTVTHDRSSVID